jgi:hypothetical protein
MTSRRTFGGCSGGSWRLVQPLNSVELVGRRTTRGGRDSIDHAPGAHDDAVNSVAGVIVLAAQGACAAVVPQATGLAERAYVPTFTAGSLREPRW